MGDDGEELARRLEIFRNYLLLLARARLDDLVRGDFYIVSTDARIAAEAAKQLAESTHLFGSKAVCLGAQATADAGANLMSGEEETDLVHNWLAEREALAALVRPDGFAYGVARTPDELKNLIASLDAALACKSSCTTCSEGAFPT